MSDLKLKNKYKSLVTEINNIENHYKLLSNNELRYENCNLQKELNNSQNLEKAIIKSFALTRETSYRILGLRHYDVQLMGGLVLHDGNIAEMKTGEGKTLVATLPAVLNGLTEKGVHIVTVNDYLATRDHNSMRPIYQFLGLKTGLITEGISTGKRKINYNADITYVTNSELTFDFLRDNIAINTFDIVLRPFYYCIIDEVDSILIDEAQTPIILSEPNLENLSGNVEKYVMSSELTNYLELNKHYEVDEKSKNVILTKEGSTQIQRILKVQNLYDPKDPWIPYILNALKAKCLFFNNVHYIIQNNRIIIVDEFTGIVMPDRRWGEGLNQAIEAKEKLPILPESNTKASITYQNFFLMYPKLSGMTGTGKTAEIEFEKIYDLSVKVIPTFKPIKRKDLTDLVYRDQFSKWNAVIKLCKEISFKSQPILIGTTTVEKSEMVSQLLKEFNLSYEVLNAKPENVKRESNIVAQAGKKNAITIATNMAGRGTDIILGGNISFEIKEELYQLINQIYKVFKKNYLYFYNQFPGFSVATMVSLRKLLKNKKFLSIKFTILFRLFDEIDRSIKPKILYELLLKYISDNYKFYKQKNQKVENKIVKRLGGLYVIGTERNDSRRIDNQLRGRCGRQGDPGISRFLISLDDSLLRLFGGSKIQTFIQNQMYDDQPLNSSFITRSLDSAQQRVEERAYDQRKTLFDYDDILNQQRRIVYFERRFLVETNLIRKKNLVYGEQLICELVECLKNDLINVKKTSDIFENLFGKSVGIISEGFSYDEVKTYFFNEFWLSYQLKMNQSQIYGNGIFENLERQITLISIDNMWKEHLDKISLLRNAVGWRGYAQKKPLVEYKRESYTLFVNSKESVLFLTLYNIFRAIII